MIRTTHNGVFIVIIALTLAGICLTGAAAAGTPATESLPVSLCYDSSDIPSHFDLREYGCVTPVRVQSPYGTCWAFSTIGAIESSLLRQGLVPVEDAETLNLSELQLIYFMAERDGVTKGEALPGFEDMLDSYFDVSGVQALLKHGYEPKALVYQLASGIGVSTEDNDLLNYVKNARNVYDGQIPPEMAVSENAFILENMTAVDIADRDLVKRLLMTLGGASVDYWMDSSMPQKYSGYYDESGRFVPTNYTTLSNSYQTEKYEGNHCVTLVGWDDTYAKENFPRYSVDDDGTVTKLSLPKNDGAWLVKNSWGTAEGLWDGYTWISYEDTSIGTFIPTAGLSEKTGNRYVIFYTMAPADSYYDSIYQYDGGLYDGGFYGKNIIFGLNDKTLNNLKQYKDGDTQTIATKNVYTAKGTELITAVSFYTVNENTDYEISVAVNSAVRAEMTGTERYEGYHTVYLKEPVLVHEGDTMEVSVAISHIKTNTETFGAVVDATMIGNTESYVTPTDIPGRSYVKFEYDTTDFESMSTEELLQCLGIDLNDFFDLYNTLRSYSKDSDKDTFVRYSLEDVTGDPTSEKEFYDQVRNILLTMIEERNALQETADENGWVDISSIPEQMALNADSSRNTLKYGSARIKLFTVDVDEETVTGNTADLPEENTVREISFLKTKPGTKVYYVDKLTNVEEPAGNLSVLGGFRIATDAEKIPGNMIKVTFTAESDTPENVILLRQNAFGRWVELPTVYLGDSTYVALSTASTLGTYAIVEKGTAGFSILQTPFNLLGYSHNVNTPPFPFFWNTFCETSENIPL